MPPPSERWSLALCPMTLLLGVLAAKTTSPVGESLSVRVMGKDSPELGGGGREGREVKREWWGKRLILVTLKPFL